MPDAAGFEAQQEFKTQEYMQGNRERVVRHCLSWLDAGLNPTGLDYVGLLEHLITACHQELARVRPAEPPPPAEGASA